MADDRVKVAEFEVGRARSRLLGTVNELSRQFEPHRIVQEVWDKAKDKGAGLAEDAVDAVRARPLAATGVVAAIAIFLAREPLMDLAGKLVDGAKGKTRKGRKPARSKAEAAAQNEKTETAE
jgi:hypothetical protein